MAENNDIVVRKAEIKDLDRIAELCGQLGYPINGDEVKPQLLEVMKNCEHAVFVAEIGDYGVVSWVHTYIVHMLYLRASSKKLLAESDNSFPLESKPQLTAEIAGLVVNSNYRKKGIGKILMQNAELWARENGCSGVILRSGENRKDAHAFYQSIGYDLIKKHLTFGKGL